MVNYELPTTAFELAQLVHDSVWQHNNVLPLEILRTSRLMAVLGHMTNTEQVFINQKDTNTEPGYETLSRSKKGTYYFQATEGSNGYIGEFPLAHFVISERSGQMQYDALQRSLILREFISLDLVLP